MEIEMSCSDTCPAELVYGPTVTLYNTGIASEQHENEKGVTETLYHYTMYRFGHMEYTRMLLGAEPDGGWDAVSHRLFRQHQHRQTDDLYSQAYRLKRTSTNPDAWADYITALDEWNLAVSALAETYSTEVPDLPEMPSE